MKKNNENLALAYKKLVKGQYLGSQELADAFEAIEEFDHETIKKLMDEARKEMGLPAIRKDSHR